MRIDDEGEEWKRSDLPEDLAPTDAEIAAADAVYERQQEERRALRKLFPSGYRCHKCGRVVTWQFRKLGLAKIDYSFGRTPDGDSFPIDRSEHLFPCVGKKIRLKDICAEFVRLATARISA